MFVSKLVNLTIINRMERLCTMNHWLLKNMVQIRNYYLNFQVQTFKNQRISRCINWRLSLICLWYLSAFICFHFLLPQLSSFLTLNIYNIPFFQSPKCTNMMIVFFFLFMLTWKFDFSHKQSSRSIVLSGLLPKRCSSSSSSIIKSI